MVVGQLKVYIELMQYEATKTLVVLMYGNRKLSTKHLARQMGANQ
jgi:prolyl-tRNA editing enzyme YbaK/EbsC (Cys-tRNA(Pro) deacylase)